MQQANITLAFKQQINHTSTGAFERMIFEDTYTEFQMQAQAYNQENRCRTFTELKTHAPKSHSLNYKVGFAIGLYIQQLNQLIPGLKDTFGQVPIPFETHLFELEESDIADRTAHRVAITYQTPPLTLYAIIGDRLLLSLNNQQENNGAIPTFLLQLQPELSITSYAAVVNV